MNERRIAVSIAAVMSLGIVGGLVARGPHKDYAWDTSVWEYSGQDEAGVGMVCRRPEPWRPGVGFTLASSTRQCLQFVDPQVRADDTICKPAA